MYSLLSYAAHNTGLLKKGWMSVLFIFKQNEKNIGLLI